MDLICCRKSSWAPSVVCVLHARERGEDRTRARETEEKREREVRRETGRVKESEQDKEVNHENTGRVVMLTVRCANGWYSRMRLALMLREALGAVSQTWEGCTFRDTSSGEGGEGQGEGE